MEFIAGSLERSKGLKPCKPFKTLKPSVQTLSSVGPLDFNVLNGAKWLNGLDEVRGERWNSPKKSKS